MNELVTITNGQPVILTKQSNQVEIKSYFEGVMHLAQGNEQFPVNLDEVWPLVYAERGVAIRSLKSNFIENEDYVSLDQNVKRATGGTTRINYFLSTSCLEYFIARKVRPVFEVYRQVFHKVTQPKQLSTLDILELSVKAARENQLQIEEVRREVKELKAATQTRPDYMTIVGYGSLNDISVNLNLASRLGQRASRICKERGIETDTIPDPRFGKVRMYPRVILDEVFNQSINR